MAKKSNRRSSRHRFFRIILISVAIVTFWWGVWGMLDQLFQMDNPVIGYATGILVALLVLYLDDFHLKELE